MGFYDDMQDIATELLTEFNQGNISGTVVVSSGPAWKPTGNTPFSFDFKGVAKGVSTKYIMRGLALEGDMEITVAVVPGMSPNDMPLLTFNLDSGDYKVISFEQIPANGTPVAWKFIARKS